MDSGGQESVQTSPSALTKGEPDEVALEDRCSTTRSVGRAKTGPLLADLRLARSFAFPVRRQILWSQRELHSGSCGRSRMQSMVR